MIRTQFIGDSVDHNIPLRWKGFDFDAVNWVLMFTAKANASDLDEAALIQKSSGIGLVLAEPTIAQVSLVPDDTIDLEPATLVWDIQARHNTTGEVHTVASGTLVLVRDIGRSITTSVPIYTTEPPAPEGPVGPVGPAGPTGPTGPAGPNSVTSATTSDGSANLLLAAATVSGTLTANHIHGNIAGSVYAHIRAGEPLAKGDPVYVSDFHPGSSTAIVSKADASNSAKMPAIGIVDAIVPVNTSGHMVVIGTIIDLSTQAYPVNSTLYVANGGGLTNVRPTSNAQPVARVERSQQNNGAIVVAIGNMASDLGVALENIPILTQSTATRTLAASDLGKKIRVTSATGCAVTIPAGLGVAGAAIVFRRTTSAGAISFVLGSGVTVNDSSVANIAQGQEFALVAVSTNNWDFV